jgi:hypothetical protein
MFVLLALAGAATSTATAEPSIRARAVIRVERAAVASRAEWERLPPARRRELVRKDELGRPIAIRVVEYE